MLFRIWSKGMPVQIAPPPQNFDILDINSKIQSVVVLLKVDKINKPLSGLLDNSL